MHRKLMTGISPSETFELACVRAELGNYERAINQVEDIWRKRDKTSSKCISNINNRVIQLLDNLEAKSAGVHTERVLKIAFEGNNKTAPSPAVPDIIKRGFGLFDKGKSAQATKYLQMAWNKRPSTDEPNEKLKLGWYLARSRCWAGNYAKAIPVLDSISRLNTTKGPPSQDHIKTLPALSQLNYGDIGLAKQNAQVIFTKYKTRKILLMGFDCHQADILLRAIAQEEYYPQKCKKAFEIWEEIYKNGKNLPLDTAGHHKKQLEYHAAAGIKLADSYESWRRGNGEVSWQKADNFREQAAQLQERGSAKSYSRN